MKNKNPSLKIEPVDPTALLRLKQVLRLVPIGASTWWLWVRQGKAPASIKLGPHTTAWRARDVLEMIERAGVDREPR